MKFPSYRPDDGLTSIGAFGEVMVKWGTEEIPRPPMGQKPNAIYRKFRTINRT